MTSGSGDRMAKAKDPDYTLNVFHFEDKDTNERTVVFLVQTTKVFVSFQYDSLLKALQEDRTINIKIQGLHAPELLMPGSGPARGSLEYHDLSGPYTVVVTKQDKTVNTFEIEIDKKEVRLMKSPEHPFIAASTDPVSVRRS